MDKIIKKKIELDTYILIGEITDYNLIDKLIEDVRKGITLSSISRKTSVMSEHTELDYLISNIYFHKFLKIIQPSIYKIFEENFVIREVWGNIYKNENDYAVVHSHENSAFCGILYCTDGPGPGTYFNQYDLTVKEKKGRFVLFHPKLLHEVKPYPLKEERITIAWNFSKTRPWLDYSSYHFIKNELDI
jgi:hypothetical protein